MDGLINAKEYIGTYTKEEIDFVIDKLKEIVQRLRDMSPLYEDFVKSNKR